jgi:hypothetical protein
MPRKKKYIEPILRQYTLPSGENDLRQFIDAKKTDMMEQAVASIEYAVDNHLKAVELFQFKDSEFVIMLSEKDFLLNLDHIYDYYITNEMYELCRRVINLKKKLGIMIKLNEM